MPFNFIRSVLDVIAPRPVQCKKSMKEVMALGSIIEAHNECYEKRYIELERNLHMERRVDIDVLITKCKRLLSFMGSYGEPQTLNTMSHFIEKLRQAKYRGDDITHLFKEFDDIEYTIKKSSKSFDNLSYVGMIG